MTPTVSTAHDPRAWRVAIALGLELGLDWARWASGKTAFDGKCWACCHRAHLGVCSGRNGGTAYACGCHHQAHVVPVPAPWDTAAYLADCARRGVDPGPLPGLEHRAPHGPAWHWRLRSGLHIRIGACWATISPRGAIRFGSYSGGCESADLTLLARLVAAAAKAMEA